MTQVQGNGMDACCQTCGVPAAQVPLPMQYPANLIYAQNMLAICMSQSQTVDLNIAQLRFYLREHEMRAALGAVLGSQAALAAAQLPAGFSAAAVAAAVGSAAPAAPAEALPGAAAAAGAAADVGAAAEGGAEGAPLENLRVHRRRLAAALKVAFVMVLLEVRTGWFFVYFFAVFLYIGGIFDPFIEWFQKRPVRVTLEQQLANLRNRQRTVEGEQLHQQQQRAAAAAAATADAAGAGAAPAEDGAAPTPAAGSATSSGDGASSPDAAAASTDAASALTGALDGAAAAPDAVAEVPAIEVPWSHRFIYQLFVMFFMTLLPWWNPDPHYL